MSASSDHLSEPNIASIFSHFHGGMTWQNNIFIQGLMYFFHFISGWHCFYLWTLGLVRLRDIERCGHKDSHSCWTLTIPSPPVTVNSAEPLFSGVLLPGMAVYVMGSGVMWSMWWAQVGCDGSGLLCSQELPLEKLPFPKELSSCFNDPLLAAWVTPSI